MEVQENPLLYSVEQTAEMLGGLSKFTIFKHIAQGNIRATRMGRRVMVAPEEIERIVREGLPSLTNDVPALPPEEALVGSGAAD